MVSKRQVTPIESLEVYKTNSHIYVVGTCAPRNHDCLDDPKYTVLKFERSLNDEGTHEVWEDPHVYSALELKRLLHALKSGNEPNFTRVCKADGLIGILQVPSGLAYLVLVTNSVLVASIAGNQIYQVESTRTISLKCPSSNLSSPYLRFLGVFATISLSNMFFFSKSYDLTRTLQNNYDSNHSIEDQYLWNKFIYNTAMSIVCSSNLKRNWFLPIIHGFIKQECVHLGEHSILITLIAKRSRHNAGARFLKRGINRQGYVANEVVTEQIVSSNITTPLDFDNVTTDNHTSYAQIRGSIPLFWSQDATHLDPKPQIHIGKVDPYYSESLKHFESLREKFGDPIVILNLIKQRESFPRETLLLKEFESMVTFLNSQIPQYVKSPIHYLAWDMARESKAKSTFFYTLAKILDETAPSNIIQKNIFQTSRSRQSGIIRTNCIDCLDRTNAAQFVIGIKAMECQLIALGLIESGNKLTYHSKLVNTLADLYQALGDSIALQYAGSNLVNTIDTYKKINLWITQPRDAFEKFRRFYSNSFQDAQRQENIDIFLGKSGLSNDRASSVRSNKNLLKFHSKLQLNDIVSREWWYEYYDVQNITSLHKTLAFEQVFRSLESDMANDIHAHGEKLFRKSRRKESGDKENYNSLPNFQIDDNTNSKPKKILEIQIPLQPNLQDCDIYKQYQKIQLPAQTDLEFHTSLLCLDIDQTLYQEFDRLGN